MGNVIKNLVLVRKKLKTNKFNRTIKLKSLFLLEWRPCETAGTKSHSTCL